MKWAVEAKNSQTVCAAPCLDFPTMKAFTQHPHSVGESYWQHMGVALSFAGALLVGACASLVHAVFPFLCTKTGSGIVIRLHERVARRR